MSVEMEVCLLGSLRVTRSGQPVTVSSPRMRALLAELAMAAGRTVSTSALVDAVWGEDPPARTQAALHTLTSRLRALLGTDPIRTTPEGYLLDIPPEQVDIHRFTALLEAASHQPNPGLERATLREALALWHGEPVVTQRAAGLVERYLQAVQHLADLDLAAGGKTDLLNELPDLVVRYPLVEPLWERAIRALAAAGRTAQALATYAQCRRTLREQLGVEPGEPLRRLYRELLAADQPPTELAPPRELPREVGHFSGRAEELQRLLDAARTEAGTSVVISAIDGMGGIGKTALAVRAAHLLAEEYPDGQLWLDLHAYTAGQPPLSASAALDKLLRRVGVPGQQIPASLDERAALWRTRLAGRRMLIVLDNALGTEQVRSLLPGAADCLVLITSRGRLTGLDDAHILSLDVLPEADAVDLFARVVGDRLPALSPGAIAEVTSLCGRLPLAVRVAASRLRHRPTWTVEHLATKLRDERSRLAELSTPDVSVSAVLGLSVQQLDPDLRALFTLLGAHPAGDFDGRAAGALADLPPAQAEALLQHLVDVNLLGERAAGRYAMHDLVRTYAAGLAEPDQSARALDRLADYYLHSSIAAMDLAYPRERSRMLRPERPPGTLPAELMGPGAALDWLATECANLIAVATCAERHTVALALVLAPFLNLTHRKEEALALHTAALAIARRDGDGRGEARVRNRLSEICWWRGRIDEATEHWQRALELARAVGDQSAEAHAVRLMGDADFQAGRRAQAERSYRAAIELAQAAGDPVVEGEAWINLANEVGNDGRHQEAYECAQRALTIAEKAGDRHVEAMALATLGHASVEYGDYSQAIDFLTDAAAIGEQIRYPKLRAYALNSLGLAYHKTGDRDAARNRYREALDLSRRIGALEIECEAVRDLGRLALEGGDIDGALGWAGKAMAAADEFAEPFRRARSRDLLGDVHHARGDLAAAAEQWRAALALYDELESVEAEPVRAKLTPHGSITP